MIGDLPSNDFLTNENSSDFDLHSNNRLALQKDSFLVSQLSCCLSSSLFLSFSQKRFTGFRNFYEFEQKRILVANDRCLKILAYHPTDIGKGIRLSQPENGKNNNAQWLPDPTEQSSGGMLLCCGGTYSNINKTDSEPTTLKAASRTQLEKAIQFNGKDGPGDVVASEIGGLAIQMINQEDMEADNCQDPVCTSRTQGRFQLIDIRERKKIQMREVDITACQKFEEVAKYEMPPNERMIYAGFLYDQNPTFVLLITINEEDNCSYLSLGKISGPQGPDQSNQDSEQSMKKTLAKKLE